MGRRIDNLLDSKTRLRQLRLVGFPCLLLACAVNAAPATDADNQQFSLNVYGTLGVTHSSDDKADYISRLWVQEGVGASTEWALSTDSRLGVQLSAEFSERVSAMLQVVSEQQEDGSYRPEVEWANVSLELVPDLRIRLGRIFQASFLYADSQKVGYSYPWVRPPTELYYLVPVNYNDGVDLRYQLQFGDVINSIGVSYGQLDADMPDRIGGGQLKVRETAGIMNTLEHGSLTVRLSYHQSRISYQQSTSDLGLTSLLDGFRLFGPQGTAIAQRYDLKDTRIAFYGVGANYDPGPWFVTSEVGRMRTQSIIGESWAGYWSVGARVGAFTPYISYARLDVTSEASTPGLPLQMLPPPLREPAAALNTALNQILRDTAAQRTFTAGVRWDFADNLALKMQYEHIDRDRDSPGTFIGLQTGFDPGGSAELFAVSLDFVF